MKTTAKAKVLKDMPHHDLKVGDVIDVVLIAAGNGSTNSDGNSCDVWKYNKPMFVPVNGGMMAPGFTVLTTGNLIEILPEA